MKPKELKILEGTFREDRDGPMETIVIADGEPVMPTHLRGEALQAWKQLVPRLVAMGVAKLADSTELGAMCEWYARYRKYSRVVDKAKATDKNLFRKVLLAGQAWKQFDKIACRFGLTPKNRAELRLETPRKDAGVLTRKRQA